MNIVSYTNNSIKKLDNSLSKIQFLSGNSIKIIAICLMFFDHFCKIVLEWYMNDVLFPLENTGQIPIGSVTQFDEFVRFTLYPIGAVAFPLFCFLISEGFFYTRNRKRYLRLMCIFALISELPFDIAFFSKYSISENTFPFYWKYQNVFFTLLIGLAALWCIEKFKCISNNKKELLKSRFLQIACVVILSLIAYLIHSDYGAYGVLLIVGFYICRKNRLYQVLIFLLIYMLTSGSQPTLSVLGSIVLLLLYKGKRGKLRLKYFFYIFYPAHIFLLYLSTLLLPNFL